MKNYQHRDYLLMIVRGLIYHYDYLPQYLIREQKKAGNNNIDFSEFIGRTIKVIEDLEGELYRLRTIKKDKLDTQKDGTNDDDIEKQKSELRVTEDFKLQLEIYTDGEFTGSIGFWDISKVRDAIHESFNFYSFEKEEENREPTEYFLNNEGTSEGDESITGKYPQIFINNYFEVWQSMFDAFQVNSSSRTDVKFMFDIMKKNEMIYDTVREVDFLKWLNETYDLEVQKISFADLRSTKRLAIFHQAKALMEMEKKL